MQRIYARYIQLLYIAYFGRPADVPGALYWERFIGNNPANLSIVAAEFAKSAEYMKSHAGLSTEQSINKIYLNLFSRPPDKDGLKFWIGALNSGEVTIDRVGQTIANRALRNAVDEQDRVSVESKVQAAINFSSSLDTTLEVLAYSTVLGQSRLSLQKGTQIRSASAMIDLDPEAAQVGQAMP